jgi:cytochrome c
MFAIRPIRLFAMAALLVAPGAHASGDIEEGDPAKGKELIMTTCVACHGMTKDDSSKPGPSLFGVVGRQAGTAKSFFGASENLKKYGVIWDAQTLDEFLADPDAKVPGTPMSGKVIVPKQRADVISYLETLKE